MNATDVDFRFSLTVFGRDIFGFHLQRESFAEAPTKAAIEELLATPAPEKPESGETVYIVSSLLLHECFKELTKTPDEDLHVLTGVIEGGRRYLQNIVRLELSHQSAAGAEAGIDSLASQLMRLHDFGLLPLAYFHSHPGKGMASTSPSGTDRATQEKLEKSGPMLGGIFSRDGFVRFFDNDSEPTVRVIGNRIKETSDNVYKLQMQGENL